MQNEPDNYLIKLKPCPWCKVTPSMYLPMYEDTWKWIIHCINRDCAMKPTTPYVSIRNTTKTDHERLKSKLDILASKWNDGNDYVAYEGKLIDLNKVTA